jgi:hypothetical protein
MRPLPGPDDIPELDDPITEAEHLVPEYWMDDDEVEGVAFNYSDRHPDDWVISGPLGRAKGPGRRFPSWGAAERWAREFYGSRFKGRVVEAYTPESTRWAFLIRGPRGTAQ